MARRSTHSLSFTPNYGVMGEPTCFTLKLYYGGTMETIRKKKVYKGGNIEYFDFVDLDKLGIIELRGYAKELGFTDENSFKLWHKLGKSLTKGRYLENDVGVLEIKDHIPHNFEVEVYMEHVEVATNNQKDATTQDGANGFHDSDFEFEEEVQLAENLKNHAAENLKGKNVVEDVGISDDLLSRMGQDEGDYDCLESDGFGSALESDEDDAPTFPMYDPIEDSKNPDLKLGMIFSSKNEAKFAIESHCIRRGRTVKFVKNDNKRLRGICINEGCNWCILCSPMNKDSCWQIKTFIPEHDNCYWHSKNRSIKAGWLGSTFEKKFKSNPKLGTSEFKVEVENTLNTTISYKQAYLAKKKAMKLVEGSIQEQFSRIRDYCSELKRTDEGASVILKLTEDDDGPRFQRLYVCFSACKDCFKDACRPVIGVDGCFLKTKTGGQLLAAVGLDPNNNIFPIAYALVEGESKDSWVWFLRLLDKDIGFENQHGWTFMSDKQKGLIPAFESLYPDAENRFCVRHLLSNMKAAGFRGVAIKNALWAAARATRVEEFKRRMEDLKKIDGNAYAWLAKKPEHHWCKAFFSTIPKCDILLNNMCECFNSMILEAREKAIIPMFESIRNMLMVRFQLNRSKAEKWDGAICPKIKVVMAKNCKDATTFRPMMADEMHFQISGPRNQHSVDLSKMSCSCRRWEMTGIPCPHAICAMWCKRENPEAYVHRYYSIEAYKRCYARSIMPINGPELWPSCDLIPPLPPVYKERVGRPAKL
ncbi:uncharacterized protein [Henckelia pumila]|uniref:uncharacterized protein n=1 Tax=Henckelia pumila TaxID=405737 RepID=UPI003C6E9040